MRRQGSNKQTNFCSLLAESRHATLGWSWVAGLAAGEEGGGVGVVAEVDVVGNVKVGREGDTRKKVVIQAKVVADGQ